MVKIPCFQGRGPGFSPWLGTRSHMQQLRDYILPRRLYYDREESWGFPGYSAVKNPFVNAGDTGYNAVLSLEKEMATPPVLLPGKAHGWRSPVGYSPWGRRVVHD